MYSTQKSVNSVNVYKIPANWTYFFIAILGRLILKLDTVQLTYNSVQSLCILYFLLILNLLVLELYDLSKIVTAALDRIGTAKLGLTKKF